MNRPIKNALLTLIMVILLPVLAQASMPLPPSHSWVGEKCSTCHATSSVADAAKNNVCLVCHKAGSVSWTNKQFFIGDMANPFGTTIETQDKEAYTHSSHEWSATDDNPAAGALPPTNTDMMTVASYVGTLSCNRCHSMHKASPNKYLLRVASPNDEMCLDCHRLRDTNGHESGTHPVNVNYANAANANPTEFFPKPVNSNPANRSSEMKLIDGKVMCTTCHGVHFTDSNSKTLDNYSTANVSGLMPSKGFLLRTDYRYMNYTSPDSPNICNNCHVDKHAHNGGKQRIRCTDCHGGHVDYDPNATDAKTMIPNIYMVKRYMNWSSTTGWKDNLKDRKQTFFRYSSDSNFYYKRADGRGVCESCHVIPPAGGKYPVEHNTPGDAKASLCNGCHTHQGPSSFTPNCTVCHAQPPVDALTAASGYQKDEALSAHAKHSGRVNNYQYGCVECHYSGAPADFHKNGNFQNLFVAGFDRLADNHGSSPVYNPSGTCSNVYCHSNGAPSGTEPMVWKDSPAWFTKNTKGCGLCHDASPTTNAHDAHTAKYTCENCHAATVTTVGSTSTIKDVVKHIDDVKEVSFSTGTLSFALSGTSCSTVYCHGGYSPDWTKPETGACGTCHATTAKDTVAHQTHLSTSLAYGPKLNQFDVATACNKCHGPNYTLNHVNGTSELAGTSNCTTSCHKNGAEWKTGRLTCESCHTGNLSQIDTTTAPGKDLASTKGHGKNLSSTGVAMKYACTTCHDQNAAHINPAVHDTRLLPAYTGTLNKECNYCHNDVTKVTTASKANMPTHVTAEGNSTVNNFPSSCSTCHDLHGSDNRNMIRASINGQAIVYTSTTSMMNPIPVNGVYVGLCQICHTKTAFYKNSAAETKHHTKDCLNCHKHQSLPFAFKGAGECSDCHGYPPVQTVTAAMAIQGNYSGARLENYSGGGGVHNVEGHIRKASSPKENWTNCTACHYGSDTDNTHMSTDYSLPRNINVKVDPKYKFDSKRPITYSGNQANDGTYYSGSCSNVSCHFKKTPKWSSEK